MSEHSVKEAIHFLESETQFHLGFLPTEQSNPLTAHMDEEFAKSSLDGVACLQRVDRNVLEMVRRIAVSDEFRKLIDDGEAVLRRGGRIVFSGCGATGRLSILLECMFRDCCANDAALSAYANQVFSIMTGGDYALVRSVEFFEDYQSFGRRQVRDLGLGAGDMLVAITEGGETSSVLGTLFEALDIGASGFLLFNNPADILAEHLERSRRAIRDPRVTVLDLSCGPMALAGSTRMQATTSEQLVAGGALESIVCRLKGMPLPDYPALFGRLLDELEAPASRKAMADYIDFEAQRCRDHALTTYFADDFLLDIFTDTTERTPTFMLPPFRKCDDAVSPRPWAFVKDPLLSTADVWAKGMKRPLRCLEWTPEDYRAMGAPAVILSNPPKIQASELLKFEVGKENPEDRCASGKDAAVLVTLSTGRTNRELKEAMASMKAPFAFKRHIAIGGEQGDFCIPCTLEHSPLELISHMAVKLALNTISTGTMAALGRVTGNWMSFVDVTNKKLLDRGIRLISEIGGLDYRSACMMLFEGIEEVAAATRASDEKVSVVQYVLDKIRNGKG